MFSFSTLTLAETNVAVKASQKWFQALSKHRHIQSRRFRRFYPQMVNESWDLGELGQAHSLGRTINSLCVALVSLHSDLHLFTTQNSIYHGNPLQCRKACFQPVRFWIQFIVLATEVFIVQSETLWGLIYRHQQQILSVQSSFMMHLTKLCKMFHFLPPPQKKISIVTSSDAKVEPLSQSLERCGVAQAFISCNLWCRSSSWVPCFMWLLLPAEAKCFFLLAMTWAGGKLPPLDTVYLKKYGCTVARYSDSQFFPHATLQLLPLPSSFALQSSKEKVVGERQHPVSSVSLARHVPWSRFTVFPLKKALF